VQDLSGGDWICLERWKRGEGAAVSNDRSDSDLFMCMCVYVYMCVWCVFVCVCVCVCHSYLPERWASSGQGRGNRQRFTKSSLKTTDRYGSERGNFNGW
jgi:hypothetical protein